jgi:hypothetical protein
MVVAEDGGHAIGTEATLTVRSSLQTAAGRMIFGRIGEDGQAEPHHPTRAPAHADDEAPIPDERADNRGPRPPNPPVRSKRPRNPRR